MINFNPIDAETLAKMFWQKNPVTVDRRLLGGVTLPEQLDRDCVQISNTNAEFEQIEQRNREDYETNISEQNRQAMEEREKREKKLSEDFADLVDHCAEKWQEKIEERQNAAPDTNPTTDNSYSNNSYDTNINTDDYNLNPYGDNPIGIDDSNPYSMDNGYDGIGTDTYSDSGIGGFGSDFGLADDGLSTFGSDPLNTFDTFDTFDDFSSF